MKIEYLEVFFKKCTYLFIILVYIFHVLFFKNILEGVLMISLKETFEDMLIFLDVFFGLF